MEACTMSNLAGQALEIFHLENCSGQLMLDRVVFSAVLSAHSWLGCLDDAAGIIRDMASDYAIRPSVEHYCAILAMLTSRSELGDAEDLAASMPFVASASACCSSTCLFKEVNLHGENDACCHTINQAQKNLHKNPGEQQSPVKQYGGYRLVNWRWHMCST
ncbi:hypothetical protein SELMODRAFT_411718 [Selaginella moellendorffii]|uniref:Pentacotripeptide-repeat region of PRORP domain-containing protein n=1 Tax=Selaginella moellendorffii TaxID=88036 RepID=D8RIT8_SELML|nr:hypothetical protein SELMODRAFT_411718 [Selaginella moellendorffii]